MPSARPEIAATAPDNRSISEVMGGIEQELEILDKTLAGLFSRLSPLMRPGAANASIPRPDATESDVYNRLQESRCRIVDACDNVRLMERCVQL